MYQWLLDHGWTEISGHDEGRIFASPTLFVSCYFGDGYWHLFERKDGSSYDWRDAAATGTGLEKLQQALQLNGWSVPPNKQGKALPIRH